MSDQVLRDALRDACHELAIWREMAIFDRDSLIDDELVDDVVAEFLDKARGFPPEGSEGASPDG